MQATQPGIKAAYITGDSMQDTQPEIKIVYITGVLCKTLSLK